MGVSLVTCPMCNPPREWLQGSMFIVLSSPEGQGICEKCREKMVQEYPKDLTRLTESLDHDQHPLLEYWKSSEDEPEIPEKWADALERFSELEAETGFSIRSHTFEFLGIHQSHPHYGRNSEWINGEEVTQYSEYLVSKTRYCRRMLEISAECCVNLDSCKGNFQVVILTEPVSNLDLQFDGTSLTYTVPYFECCEKGFHPEEGSDSSKYDKLYCEVDGHECSFCRRQFDHALYTDNRDALIKSYAKWRSEGTKESRGEFTRLAHHRRQNRDTKARQLGITEPLLAAFYPGGKGCIVHHEGTGSAMISARIIPSELLPSLLRCETQNVGRKFEVPIKIGGRFIGDGYVCEGCLGAD